MKTAKQKEKQPVLVLGGTGKTGHRVVERLEKRDWPVRVGSRRGTPPFDWQVPATWAPVLEGMSAVYITFQPDLAVPGAAEAIRTLTDQAVAAGVRHLVLLSGRGEPEAQRCEAIVREAGVDWTILRTSWFCQNFSESYLLEPIREGVLALPAGLVREPFVDADDIADVAVAALTEEGHAGQLYELTGPQALTFEEVVQAIGRATSLPIRYVPVTAEAYAAALRAQQVPEPYTELLIYLFTEVMDGRNASPADGVEQALGRPATDFAGYIRKTAETGVWNPVTA